LNSPRLKGISKTHIFFLLPYFIFLVSGAALIILSPKDKLHLFFNSYHTDTANRIFYYLTFLGDGWTALFIAIVLLFVRYRYSIIITLTYGLSSAVAQSLKHYVFSDHDRPAKFFENNPSLYLVPGVDNNIYYSFPSGHATTAFAIYFGLALFTSNKWLQLCWFMLALVVSYSRVYLSQHFFEDIYAGSAVGIMSTLIIYRFLQPAEQPGKLDKSFLSLTS
jgi:membrane-associated phospholipid phosphatase